LLRNHIRYTKSVRAQKVVDDFSRQANKFVKVMPREYKRILEAAGTKTKQDTSEVSDG